MNTYVFVSCSYGVIDRRWMGEEEQRQFQRQTPEKQNDCTRIRSPCSHKTHRHVQSVVTGQAPIYTWYITEDR